jgi:hypothetical protein
VEKPEPTVIRALFPKVAESAKRLDTGIRASFSKAKTIFKRQAINGIIIGVSEGIGVLFIALDFLSKNPAGNFALIGWGLLSSALAGIVLSCATHPDAQDAKPTADSPSLQ